MELCLQEASGEYKKAREDAGVQRTSGIPVMSGARSRQINTMLKTDQFLPFLSTLYWNIFTPGEVGEGGFKDGKSIY